MTVEEVTKKLEGLTGTISFIYRDGEVFEEEKKNIEIRADRIIRIRQGWALHRQNIVDVVQKAHDIESSITLGSDPEFFFVKDGDVVPSTVVLQGTGDEVVVPDGFQGELNPNSDTCRVRAGSKIAQAIIQANEYAEASGVELDFNVAHVISDSAWKSAPLKLKRFGCNPTENVYQTKFKRVSGLRERFRAAGGHIHVGGISAKAKADLSTLVKVMDIVVGNTFVLIDRDPLNARRRKNYGVAGEHRVKPYGLEYRVLSNFWLKHYTLWSFAAGLIRNAVGIFEAGLAPALIDSFEMGKVCQAINNNDYDLALQNFKKLSEFIKANNLYSGTALSKHNIDDVESFLTSASPTRELSITTTKGVINGWREFEDEYVPGFEEFIKNR